MSKASTLTGRVRAKTPRELFKPAVIIALIFIGLFAFSALLTLSGYADDLREKSTGEASPLSRSAIGYGGAVDLLRHLDYEVELPTRLPNRIRRANAQQTLRIYTPASPYVEGALEELDTAEVKLIILPKWNVERLDGKRGWVRVSRYGKLISRRALGGMLDGLIADQDGAEIEILRLADTDYLDIQAAREAQDETTDKPAETKSAIPVFETLSGQGLLYAPDVEIRGLQVFSAKGQDIILSAESGPVMIRLTGTKTYILSDPDLINTAGIASKPRAKLAVDVVNYLITSEQLRPQSVEFDLTLHGIADRKNLIKLLTQPPFLAATLCLFFAGLLVAWQGFIRYGDPRPAASQFAQGPAALANTAAEFMGLAGRTTKMGPDYAQLIRRQVIREMGLRGRPQKEIDTLIAARETRRDISPNFAALAGQMTNPDPTQFTAQARALARWKEEMQ